MNLYAPYTRCNRLSIWENNMFHEYEWIKHATGISQSNDEPKRKQATRQRIVEAAVALHGSVGASAATVTVIAERAGVGRVTLYRHFPDERALLQRLHRSLPDAQSPA